MIKKILIIIMVIFLILAAGCSQPINVEEPDLINVPENIDKQETADIYSGVITLYYANQVKNPSEDFVKRWEDYILNKYRVDIKLNFIKSNNAYSAANNKSITAGVDIDELESKVVEGGLLYMPGGTSINALAAANVIEPVNTYINEIPLMTGISETITGQFTDRDGKIWAFPLCHNVISPFRAYNKDWIEKWGKGIPETLDEFLEYAKYVRTKDPDGDGINNTYIQAYNPKYVLNEFQDIFRAFGCYPYINFASGYNPQSGEFEIVTMNEGFMGAVNYIKFLIKEDLVYMNTGYYPERNNPPYMLASSNRNSDDFDELKCGDSLLAGYYMSGPNKLQLIPETTRPSCIVVLEGTENVPGQIETLLDIFEKNQDSFMDFYVGIKGESYEDNNDFYTFKSSVNRIRIFTDIPSRLYEEKPWAYLWSDKDLSPVLWVPKNQVARNFKIDKLGKEARKIQNSSLFYPENALNQGDEILTLGFRLLTLTENLMDGLLVEETDSGSQLDKYMNQLKRKGILDDLETLNSK